MFRMNFLVLIGNALCQVNSYPRDSGGIRHTFIDSPLGLKVTLPYDQGLHSLLSKRFVILHGRRSRKVGRM